MSLEAVIGEGEKREVSVEQDKDGSYRVTIDGHTHLVRANGLGNPLMHLNMDGRIAHVGVHQTEIGYDVVIGGRCHPVDIADPRRRALKGAMGDADGPMDVVSPMPGKVIKVLVEVGQTVAKGDGLVVVEAMKMENEYKAARDGVVAGVFVAAGETIESGAKLVRLDAVEDA